MRHNSVPPSLASVAVSTTIFCIGASIGLEDAELLRTWPGVFLSAGIQHLIIVAPVYLIITRLWGPVTQSPLWSFALWGAGLATAPWMLLAMTDGHTPWTFQVGFLVITCLSGVAGGLAFGKLVREHSPTPAG